MTCSAQNDLQSQTPQPSNCVPRVRAFGELMLGIRIEIVGPRSLYCSSSTLIVGVGDSFQPNPEVLGSSSLALVWPHIPQQALQKDVES